MERNLSTICGKYFELFMITIKLRNVNYHKYLINTYECKTFSYQNFQSIKTKNVLWLNMYTEKCILFIFFSDLVWSKEKTLEITSGHHPQAYHTIK